MIEQLSGASGGYYGGASYSYDPWGRRVEKNLNPDPQGINGGTGFTGTGNYLWEFYFYGPGGRKLATIGCTYVMYAGPYPQFYACTVTEGNVYFAGKLVGWTAGQPAGSAGGDGPSGERAGRHARPQYGDDAVLSVRDGTDADDAGRPGEIRDVLPGRTGAGYAEQRCYNGLQGKFWSPDPSLRNVDYSNPVTWNAYAYANGDPVGSNDPDGMTTCGDLPIDGGGTVAGEVNANTAQGHFIDLVWHEGGFLSQVGGNVAAWLAEFEGVAQAIWDRYLIVSGGASVVGANGVVYQGRSASALGYGAAGAPGDATLNRVLEAAAAETGVLGTHGQLVAGASTLQAELGEEQGNTSIPGPGKLPLVNALGEITAYVTDDCYSVIAALESANSVVAGINFNPPGDFITSWNVSAPVNNPNYQEGVEYYLGKAGVTNFYGFTGLSFGELRVTSSRATPAPVAMW